MSVSRDVQQYFLTTYPNLILYFFLRRVGCEEYPMNRGNIALFALDASRDFGE
jgi:hypothetical protein